MDNTINTPSKACVDGLEAAQLRATMLAKDNVEILVKAHSAILWSLMDECLSFQEETVEDYYKILEVDYDATEEKIRLNYLKLALKWHPDKHKDDDAITAKFQEINEAYQVLSDPGKRLDYDLTGIYEIDKYTLREYLARFKGLILTCNGLGINHTSILSQQLMDTTDQSDNQDLVVP